MEHVDACKNCGEGIQHKGSQSCEKFVEELAQNCKLLPGMYEALLAAREAHRQAVTSVNIKHYTSHCIIPDRYKAFQIEFRGWFGLAESDAECGQWLCATIDSQPIRTFYASYPGGEGEFHKGDSFDVAARTGQIAPYWNARVDENGCWKSIEDTPWYIGIEESFNRLIKLLDKEFPDLQ